MRKKAAVFALSFTLLIALTGIAQALPPNQIIGSYSCEADGMTVFLVSFNTQGVFTATSNDASVSVNHGSYKRKRGKTYLVSIWKLV
jgi:hypothetical protein